MPSAFATPLGYIKGTVAGQSYNHTCSKIGILLRYSFPKMNGQLQSNSDILSTLKDIPSASHNGNWVVQKFGGTSVGKFAHNIIDQVVL